MRGRMVFLMHMVAVTALFNNLPLQLEGAFETERPNVVDAEGHPVVVGREYYVPPAVAGSGGGLALKKRVKNSCPMYVTQENSETSRGLPLVLKPADGQSGNYSSIFVQEHAQMNVIMAAQTVCVQSTAWSVQNENDGNTTKRFIKDSDASSLLTIVKAIDGDGYFLHIFYRVNCRIAISTVGIYVDYDENRWLQVIDRCNCAEALRVQFHKNGWETPVQ